VHETFARRDECDLASLERDARIEASGVTRGRGYSWTGVGTTR